MPAHVTEDPNHTLHVVRNPSVCAALSPAKRDAVTSLPGNGPRHRMGLNRELPGDLSGMPEELRAAFHAAGIVEQDYLDPGEADHGICMRAVCALTDLSRTFEDLRRIPLLITPFT